MTPFTVRELRERLLSEGQAPPPETDWAKSLAGGPPAPWFAKMLLGLGGWLAAVLLAFGLGLVLRDLVKGVFGVVVCVAMAALRRFVRGPFATQLVLALSLAGQGLFAFATSGHEAPKWLAVAVLELVLLAAFADPVHRFLSAGFCAAALAAALSEAGAPEAVPPVLGAVVLLVWIAPGRFFRPPLAVVRRPLGYGFAVVFAASFVVPILHRHHVWDTDALVLREHRIVGAAAAVVLAVAIVRILVRLRASPASGAGVAGVVAGAGLAALGLWAPGVPAALGLMGISAENREPLLFAVSATAGVSYLSWWYYDLSTTLPVKAMALVASGVLLLGLRAFLRIRRTA